MNALDLIVPGLGSVTKIRKKQKLKAKQARLEEAEQDKAKIDELKQEYAQSFGKDKPFETDEQILNLLLQRTDLITQIKNQYQPLVEAQSNKNLLPYDRQNLAMIMMKNLANTNPNLQHELSQFAASNNIPLTTLNRTIIAWIKED